MAEKAPRDGAGAAGDGEHEGTVSSGAVPSGSGTDPAPDAEAAGAVPSAGLLRAAVVVAVLEGLGLAAYSVGIVVSSLGRDGENGSTAVAGVVFLLLAAGILLCAWSLRGRRRAARTPFGVIQLFGLVVGWTLTQGDGDVVHRIGYAVLAVCVVGIALVMSPGLGAALED
jgi:hypothetical protein